MTQRQPTYYRTLTAAQVAATYGTRVVAEISAFAQTDLSTLASGQARKWASAPGHTILWIGHRADDTWYAEAAVAIMTEHEDQWSITCRGGCPLLGHGHAHVRIVAATLDLLCAATTEQVQA